jgi:acyl carrier protein
VNAGALGISAGRQVFSSTRFWRAYVMSATIQQIVLATVAAVLHIEPSAVTIKKTLDALGADSLDRINIGISVEYALGLEMDMVHAREWVTVEDVLRDAMQCVHTRGIPEELL